MWRPRMNRTIACMLSLFMPVIVVFPVVLLLVNLPTLSKNASAFFLIAAAAGIIALRVHFASWYARDKGRSGAWGVLGVFGILGWCVLWMIDDRGIRFVR